MDFQNNPSYWHIICNAVSDAVAFIRTDGTIINCNNSFANFVNDNVDSIVGLKCYQIIHRTEDFPENCTLIRSLKSGKREFSEIKFDEKIFSIAVDPVKDLHGNILAFAHNMRDITEQKRAEEALRESEAKYRLVVENASEAIVIAQDGLIKFVNPKALEISGYSEEELISKPFIEFLHPDDRETVLNIHINFVSNKENVPEKYVFRIIDKYGDIKWLEKTQY